MMNMIDNSVMCAIKGNNALAKLTRIIDFVITITLELIRLLKFRSDLIFPEISNNKRFCYQTFL